MVIDQWAAGSPVARADFKTTRRGLLTGAAAFGVSMPLRPARAETAPSRIACIDWAMLETALSLGITPVAAAELLLFRKSAVEPAVPAEVADLGLRGSIAYEQLLGVRPDLILISPWYENRAHVLQRIAPVESFSIRLPGRPPYCLAIEATRKLGVMTGRAREAEQAIADAGAEIDRAASSIAHLKGRPTLVMNLGDARHFRAFGADSMFGDVLGRLGLVPAWTAPTRFGAFPTVGVEELADMPDAIVVNVGPTPPSALAEMRASPLWRAMPPIAAGRFVDIPSSNPYGALPAAKRFARLASQALATLPNV